VRPKDRLRAEQIESNLCEFDASRRALLGIRDATRLETLIEQIIESLHRVKYPAVLLQRPLGARFADPDDELFDLLKAAIVNQRAGRLDEAFWLIFLFVHFGKHSRGGWRIAREVYGRLGEGGRWNWASVSSDPAAFRNWLRARQDHLRRSGCGFGNHRKYQSMDADSRTGTGEVIASYVRWVSPPRTHEQLVATAIRAMAGDRRASFRALYESMRPVIGFGRTARFDYLTMLGKTGLAPIEPDSAYLTEATGPVPGARLLFLDSREANASPKELESWLNDLDASVGVGMQVWEDALCNWQKSPDEFRAFRG
jgi:hypothetical protein